MKKIRMIVTDLDGTLLHHDKTVSPETLSVIAQARAAGALFVIATARPIRGVKGFIPGLEFDGALYHNGAVVTWRGERLEGFGVAQPLEVVNLIRATDPALWMAVEADDKLYSNFNATAIWQGVAYTRTEDFREIERAVADKIIVEARTLEELEAVSRLLPDDLYAQLSENRIAMIMNRRATKENGVRLLAKRLGIGMDEIAAFGDDYNDIGMLRACGAGVAVENALDEVKAAADDVCPCNEADGPARWIEEKIL